MLQEGKELQRERERERVNAEGMPFALSQSRGSFTLALTEELGKD